MHARISNDPGRGPGYATIVLEVGDAQLPSMPAGLAFTLQRASDGLFLAQNGWQESQAEHVPDDIQQQPGQRSLSVGPEVIDHIDSLDTYRLQLPHTSLPACVLHMDALDYSPLKGKEGLQTAPAPASPVIPMAAVITAPEAPVEAPAEDLPESPVEPLSMAPPESPEPAPKNTGKVWIVASILLLALAGGGWYYYWLQQQGPLADKSAAPTENAAPQEKTDPAKDSANKDAPATEDPAKKDPAKDKAPAVAGQAPAPAGQAPAQNPMNQARSHLQGPADPGQSLNLARTLLQQNSTVPQEAAQNADAIFLLVEDAAQKGAPEAMLLLARYFDPVDKAPKGSIQSDPQQALRWYQQAQKAGRAEAGPALTALHTWAEQSAAQGNAAARQLLQDWN